MAISYSVASCGLAFGGALSLWNQSPRRELLCCEHSTGPLRWGPFLSKHDLGSDGLGLGRNARPVQSPSCRLPPFSLRLAPSAGEPLANTVSEYEANDQHDCSFWH